MVPIARALPILRQATEMTCYQLQCAGLPTLAERIICCREWCSFVGQEEQCQKEAFEDPNIKQTDKLVGLAGLYFAAQSGNPAAIAAMREVGEIKDPLTRLYAQRMASELK